MTGPIPLPPGQYPAHLQLCYRGVKYRRSRCSCSSPVVAGDRNTWQLPVALVLTTLHCQGDRNQ